ncbi:hypothetical protein [Winogradskyella costae]|uniref:hypothetical protein n=1 Tax=Winogradskyella costae TaxID=2697008 RepID=UPI0015C8DFF7|nr:hypothetical protein [Winogradskyella costae]
MTSFRTYLIINLKDSKLVETLDFSETNFKLEYRPEPTNCYWEVENGEIHYTGGKDLLKDSSDRIEYQQNELIISAENEDIAENALSLLKGGILLGFPTPSTTLLDLYVSEFKETDSDFYKNHTNYFRKIENVGFGCQVLEKIIHNRECSYALEKYKVSLELHSFSPHSADPMYGQVFDHYDYKKQTHTRSAFAIISAFSVIEELGLEIRSSAKNPRFLNSEKGEWNPKVLNNIEKRLNTIGIDKSSTFDWIFRGDKTEVEKDFKPYFGYDSQWTKYGKNVRDKTLTFPEAIHNASYLRNFIASHKFKELTEFISPYDVFNVQCLARKLILENLGIWETMLGRKKKNSG